MLQKEERNKKRIAIVEAAARRSGCSMNEFFIRVLNRIVTDLKKIPERVIRYARRILRQHIAERATKKRRQQYFRGAPFMRAC